MRKIAVVGAGQAGLLIGFGLLKEGYDVTLYSDRGAETILHGGLPNTAVLFGDSLAYEKSLGLNFWDDDAPCAEGMAFDFRAPNGDLAFQIHGRLHEKKGQALDHRTKFHRWMNEFEKRGGALKVANVDPDALEKISAEFDLTLVAGGKGQVTRLFETDTDRSLHDKPVRHLACAVLTGGKVDAEKPWDAIDFTPIRLHCIAEVGEIISLPFYSHTQGHCRAVLVESVPNGPIDHMAQGGLSGADEILSYIKSTIDTYVPEDTPLFDQAELVDAKACLRGAFTPTVRKPVADLGSGNIVMAVGDAAVLNDPVGGQGANNATRMAQIYVDSILAHGNAPFDRAWMENLFEEAWEKTGAPSTYFTEGVISEPGEPMLAIMGAASQEVGVAEEFVSCFNDPTKLLAAVGDVASAQSFIEKGRETVAA